MDTPQGMGVSATTTTSSNADMEMTSGDTTNTKQLWKFLYIDLDFMKSLYGILNAAEVFLSLLGLICVAVPDNEGCAYLYGSGYSYYEFVSSSCFITASIFYVLYLFMVTKKLGFIRWDITEVIWCAFYAIQFLIGSSIVASNACQQGGYKAAAAFGFLCLFVIIGHGAYQARSVWLKRQPTARTTTYAADGSQPPEYDAEEAKY